MSFIKKIIPHVVAIALFLMINVVLFSPILFEGKSINQNDVLQGYGSGQELVEFRNSTDEEGLWTNSMFSGMPAYLINVYWSGDLLRYAQKAMSLGLPSPATHTFVAMVSFYILMLVFGVNPYLAIAGAMAYGANPYFIILIEAGHIWKIAALSWMPLVLAGIELSFRKKYLLGFAITAFSMAMEIRSNHLQITYYLLLIVLLYGLFKIIEIIKAKSWADLAKIGGVLILAVTLGVMSNLGKLWSTYEYGELTIRGKSELTSSGNTESGGLDKDYAFGWSNGVTETFTLLVPNFYGGATVQSLDMNSTLANGLQDRGVPAQQIKNFISSVPTYWGDQPFTSGPAYIGAIMVFLFVLGLFVIPGNVRWWLLSATILGIILSWGKNFEAFNYFVFDYLPGYNKFRAVSTTIIIPILCVPILGTLALQQVFKDGLKKHQKNILIALSIVGGICLLMIISSGMMSFNAPVDAQFGEENPWLVDLIRDQRASMFRADAIRSLILILLTSVVIYFYSKNKIGLKVAAAIFTALVVFDFMGVNNRYLKEDNFVRNLQKTYFAPTQADQRILQDQTLHYRVLNLNNPFNEAKTSYFHSSIGGYHGAKLRRYADLIERNLDPEMGTAIAGLQGGNPAFSQTPVLNMLNTKYIKFGDKQEQVIRNDQALGNAWFVQNVKIVNNPDEEIAALTGLDTENEAVLDGSKFQLTQKEFSKGEIKLEQYQPNYLKYAANSSANGLVVFSEVYYPHGWKAYIDGNETDIKRVNYVLRALELTSGVHTVEFKFEPRAYTVGNIVTLFSSAMIIICLIAVGGIEIRKRV
jgi:hypothetical protein